MSHNTQFNTGGKFKYTISGVKVIKYYTGINLCPNNTYTNQLYSSIISSQMTWGYTDYRSIFLAIHTSVCACTFCSTLLTAPVRRCSVPYGSATLRNCPRVVSRVFLSWDGYGTKPWRSVWRLLFKQIRRIKRHKTRTSGSCSCHFSYT